VFVEVAPDDSWADAVLLLLQSVTLVTALWTSGVARVESAVNLVLVTLAAVSAVLLILVGGTALDAFVGVLSAVLVFATAATVILGIIDQREANPQAVLGAVCVYVLLGMMFVFIYGVLATLGDGNFFAQGTDGTRSVRVYFSYTTLVTLGYGDYTAKGELGRTFAISEALIGQLYLVTVIALLISRIRAAPHDDR